MLVQRATIIQEVSALNKRLLHFWTETRLRKPFTSEDKFSSGCVGYAFNIHSMLLSSYSCTASGFKRRQILSSIIFPHATSRALLKHRGYCSTSNLDNQSSDVSFQAQGVIDRRKGLGKPKGYVAHAQYKLDRHVQSGLPNQIAQGRPFTVLGIESSCDDTGAAVVRSDGTILSNVVYSQYEVHQRFGGVVPTLAMNAHTDNIDKAVTQALHQAGLKSVADIDAIAVTKGPGLEVCLRVGCRKAQALAIEYNKPFVTAHHLEAHCLIARLAGNRITASKEIDEDKALRMEGGDTPALMVAEASQNKPSSSPTLPHFTPKVNYPFLTLLVSGGHTSLMLCKGLGEYELLGGTLDDSLGESFDKAARLLGLRGSGSGGAAVERAAAASLSAIEANRLRNRALAIISARQSPTHDLTEQERLAKRSQAKEERCASAIDAVSNPDKLAPDDKQALRMYYRGTVASSCAMFQMKVPLRDRKADCDFSYSGLKNSFRMAVDRARAQAGLPLGSTNAPLQQHMPVAETDVVSLPDTVAAELCYAFQDIAFAHIEDRVDRALEWISAANNKQLAAQIPACTALVVVGGVAANLQLRQRLLDLLAARARRENKEPLPLIFPPVKLCTDNGVMSAWTGIEKLLLGISDDPQTQEVVARWPLGNMTDLQQWEIENKSII